MKFLLAASPRVRYATGMTMYFAQGIPSGLLAIAMPAWLAASCKRWVRSSSLNDRIRSTNSSLIAELPE